MSENRSKLHRLERLMKVQGQKRLLEEWRLGHLRKERDEIDRSDTELLASLGTDSQLHGLFVEAKVRNLRRNDAARRTNLAHQSETEKKIQSARRSEKGVEKIRDEARRSTVVEDEARELQVGVDGFLARKRTSFE
ncbi:MAG TPA: hypothetical protein VIN77_14255 [Aurantimonas sp.]|uniref:Uncharacterized protein n=1 Tax=Aurantimonas marianensis TaxID=2920428 RepID=A0A9X2KEZ0_9HYPH|nr:hypothetical protein [Aurantimonas marianensis]MCP3055928.1 hypothetical protein [Aurantimonas marianensis]